MKKFAYLINYGSVGSIIWERNGFYKISFFHENIWKTEIFIIDEIQLRSTDGFEEMKFSELKRFVKSNKLKEKDIDSFAVTISKLDKTDIYIIIENLRSANLNLFNMLKQKLEDNKFI
jgi:hypothetical protein